MMALENFIMHAFETRLEDAFDTNQVAWVTDMVTFPPPVPPAAALAREAAHMPQPGDALEIREYRKILRSHSEAASKALSLMKGLLGAVPLALIDPIISSNILTTRLKVSASKQRLRREYGAANAPSISAHIGDMDELPPIYDAPSALNFMTSLTLLNSVLRKLGAAQTDDQLRQRLYKNLIGPMFEKVALDIATNPLLTYAQACTAVRDIIEVKEQRDNHARHLSAMHPHLFPPSGAAPQIQSAWSSSVSPSSHFQPPAAYAAQIPSPLPSQQLAGYPPFASQPSSVNPAIMAMQAPPPTGSSDRCWNCFGPHRPRECPAPFCRNCNSSWPSLDAPGYHLFTACQSRSKPPARKQSYDAPPSTRSGPPRRPPFDYRNKRRGSVNAMTGAPQTDLEAMAGYDDTAWDAYLASQSVDSSYDDGQYQDPPDGGAYYAMMQAQPCSVQMPSIASCDAGPCAAPTFGSPPQSVLAAMRTLQDSGANVSATPPITAVALGLTIYKWDEPFLVTFGNGTSSFSNHYVYLGPLLGKTAILNSCTHTVLSVPDVNSRGFDVLFSKSMRCFIWNDDGDLIVEAPIDTENRLYYVDLQLLLLEDLTPSGGCTDRA
jgi:hypothetical protein